MTNDAEYLLAIRDSMLVSLGLGYLYLWVDKYCIYQEDPEDKAYFIRNMDNVYQCADITIIAAAGRDPNYGLASVSKRPQISLPAVKLYKQNFVSTLQPQHENYWSVWWTRGWTYQAGDGSFALKSSLYRHPNVAKRVETIRTSIPGSI